MSRTMETVTRSSFSIFLVILSVHSQSTTLSPQLLQTLTLEEAVPLRPEFYPDRFIVQWISDVEYIYRDPNGIKKFNAETGELSIVLNAYELLNLGHFSTSSFSADGKNLLMMAKKKKIYRYSSTAEYSVYDLETRAIYNISQGPLQVVEWGSNRSLAYVKDNNVYFVPDITLPKVVALTTEGIPGEVYYGATDWIYEEEIFNAAEAMWFSPSGIYLAVASFNDTQVEMAKYPIYGKPGLYDNQYPEMMEFKYPKTGRTNPEVGLRVFLLNQPESTPLTIPAPIDVVGTDHILGRVNWASEKNLVVLWLNRRQNISVLVNCDLYEGKCNMINKQTELNGWIDIHEPFFDRSGTKMVEIRPLFSNDQRFPHAAFFDYRTMSTADLSPGNSTVTEVLGWQQDTNTVYYILAPGNVPWQRQLWATSAGVARCVSCKEPACRHVSAWFSKGASHAIISCSASNVAPRIFLFRSQDESFNLLLDNRELNQKLSTYKLPLTLFNVISLGDSLRANVELLLPPDMQLDQKYPMVVRVYSGPGTSRVSDKFNLDFYSQYLSSNRSFITASIDVRGSGVMGVEAMHAVNLALGTVEVTDTLLALKRLSQLYSFIDPKKIGVWGWSYGGFATTMMLVQDTENILACGAAVAPVTSWLYYDSIYTERYMSTPQDNPIGYEQSDLTLHAEKLRGRQYLLVHGTGDDNVHYQNSMHLSKQLQHADIAFEQMSYTDETHGLVGVSRHLYHTLDHFWTECFSKK